MDWEYSRTARKHWHDDGGWYNRGEGYFYRFEIRNLTQDNHYNQSGGEGYDLLHKGVKIAHAKKVKELKQIAEGAIMSDAVEMLVGFLEDNIIFNDYNFVDSELAELIQKVKPEAGCLTKPNGACKK